MAAKYTNPENTIVSWEDPETGVVWSIPITTDPTEMSVKFDAWLAQGNTIDPYQVPDARDITKLQMYKQLRSINKLAQVRALLTGLTDIDDALLEWETSETIVIDGPLITAIKAELGLTDAQVQNFFNNASTL